MLQQQSNKEKTQFTESRLTILRKEQPTGSPFSGIDLTDGRIQRLEKQFGSYCFVPLDLPRIDLGEEFKQWFFEEAKILKKLRVDVATDVYDEEGFYGIDVSPKYREYQKTLDSIWSKNFYDYFDHIWPDLYQQLGDLLPLKKIEFSIWSSIREIRPHRDESCFLDLPADFRLLIDSNPTPNLFVSESLPDSGRMESIQTISVPTQHETNFFAWNNLRCKHHSVYHDQYPKLIFLFNNNMTIDWKKYTSLIERSVDKYKDQCMISKNDISDFVYL